MASPARTITVALDMRKAFNTINIHTLIRKLAFHKVASFHPHRFRSWHTQTTSPLHLHTQARVQPRNTYNLTYIKFLPVQNNLILNPDKTNCTLFTPDPAEYTSNLDLKINKNALPMAMHPKVLGLTVDPQFAYSTHIHNISVHAHKSIIKALTATGWGTQKQTFMATYKVVMRPSLEYASSIWSVASCIRDQH